MEWIALRGADTPRPLLRMHSLIGRPICWGWVESLGAGALGLFAVFSLALSVLVDD